MFDTLVSMEDLSQGQHIAEYSLDVFIHGQQVDTGWQSLPALGKTVGHKVIDGLPFLMPTSLKPTCQIQKCCLKSIVGNTFNTRTLYRIAPRSTRVEHFEIDNN